MITLLLGIGLILNVATGQTPAPAKATKPSATSTAPASQSAAQPAAKSSGKTRAGARATNSMPPASSTAPPKPLPEHSLQTKLQSDDNSNPNYRKEKARGRGFKREYTPRRTASGARPDTMQQRRP